MSEPVRVLVVLHGDRVEINELPQWAANAHNIVAADGGVEHLLNTNVSPNVVTGDFDGMDESVRANLPSEILEVNGDQNTTDCQKALALAERRFGATDIVVFGSEGSRIDHVISTLGACAAVAARVRVVFGRQVAYIVDSRRPLACECREGLPASLMPLVPTRVARTSGLRWPADGMMLALGERDGVSNRTTGREFSVTVESGCLAVFVGRFEGDICW
jgi:thiamine pyrophosphokinase